MIRVKRADGRHESFGGGTIRCDVSGAGDLLVSRVQTVEKLGPGGMMQGVEQTPLKIFAAGQWHEAENVEEPGDGLTIEPPRAVESRP